MLILYLILQSRTILMTIKNELTAINSISLKNLKMLLAPNILILIYQKMKLNIYFRFLTLFGIMEYFQLLRTKIVIAIVKSGKFISLNTDLYHLQIHYANLSKN